MGTPNNIHPEFLSPKKQEEFFNNDPKQVRKKLQLELQSVKAISNQLWKNRVKLSISPILLQEWHTKMRVAHQDEDAVNSEWHTKMRLGHQD